MYQLRDQSGGWELMWATRSAPQVTLCLLRACVNSMLKEWNNLVLLFLCTILLNQIQWQLSLLGFDCQTNGKFVMSLNSTFEVNNMVR